MNISNAERAQMGNSVHGEIMIRIHADGSANASTRGVTMLIPSAAHGNSGTMINRSRNAGLAILDRVVTNTEAVNRGIVERADLSGFNWSEIPVVLLETGFMTNPQEDILLNSGGYQDKIVRGIYEGLIIYFRDRSQESLVQKNSHAGRFVD